MVSITSTAASLLRRSQEAFLKVYESTPADKLVWKPEEGNGRSALDVMHECIVSDKFSAATIQSGAFPKLDWAAESTLAATIPHDEIANRFRSGNNDLLAVIESVPDDRLDVTFQFPGSEREWTMAELLFLPGSHLDYHTGQLNYVQTLYGDRTRR